MALKTRGLARVPFHCEQCSIYVGYERMVNEEFSRANEVAMVTKNAVFAAAEVLRAEKESDPTISSRIPSPNNTHVRDGRQVPPEIFISYSNKQGPLQD